MKTSDEISKIKAIVLYVLKDFPRGVDYIKLFKILYFAQREHILTYGLPMFDETFRAAKHGPIPSFTYASFNSETRSKIPTKDLMDFAKDFHLFHDRKGIKMVKSVVKPDMDELSKSNILILDEKIAICKNQESYDLSYKSHDSAWEAAYQRALDDPEQNRITMIEMARSGGASAEMIDYIRENELFKSYLTEDERLS